MCWYLSSPPLCAKTSYSNHLWGHSLSIPWGTNVCKRSVHPSQLQWSCSWEKSCYGESQWMVSAVTAGPHWPFIHCAFTLTLARAKSKLISTLPSPVSLGIIVAHLVLCEFHVGFLATSPQYRSAPSWAISAKVPACSSITFHKLPSVPSQSHKCYMWSGMGQLLYSHMTNTIYFSLV